MTDEPADATEAPEPKPEPSRAGLDEWVKEVAQRLGDTMSASTDLHKLRLEKATEDGDFTPEAISMALDMGRSATEEAHRIVAIAQGIQATENAKQMALLAAASNTLATEANKHANALRPATWVLVFVTVVMTVATVVLAIVTAAE